MSIRPSIISVNNAQKVKLLEFKPVLVLAIVFCRGRITLEWEAIAYKSKWITWNIDGYKALYLIGRLLNILLSKDLKYHIIYLLFLNI